MVDGTTWKRTFGGVKMVKEVEELLEDDPELNEYNEDNTDELEDEEFVEREVNSESENYGDEIGHVVTSEELKVSRRDNEVYGFVTTDKRNKVRLGDYLEIDYPDKNEILFATIEGLKYEPYTEMDDKNDMHHQITKAHELEESDYPLIAEIDPISILQKDGENYTRKSVDRVPKPNTGIKISEDEKKLRTGLNIPQDGVFVGYVAVGGKKQPDNPPLPYFLQNPGIDSDGNREEGEPAVFRHLLVSGSTGKGKTHFNKNLLRQFVKEKRYPIKTSEDREEYKKLGIVIIDPENEYSELAEDNPDLENVEKLKKRGIEVGGVNNLKTFIPDAEATNTPTSVNQFMKFTIPFSLVKERPQLLWPFKPSQVQEGALEDLIDHYFENNEQKTYKNFIKFLKNNEEDLKDEHKIHEGTWRAVMSRIDKKVYQQVFDQGEKPITEITNEIFRPGQISVIPTSHLRGRKENLVVLSILTYIVENKIDDYKPDKHIKETPILLSVDEAHNYLASTGNIQEEYIIQKFRQAAKQGRKDKLGLNMITQNPQDIDDQILKQTNTRILLGLSEEVVESINVPKGYKKDIPLFKKGQAVIKAPDVEPVEIQGLKNCLTKHTN